MGDRALQNGSRIVATSAACVIISTLIGACAAERPTTPLVAGSGAVDQLRALAFTFDVNARTRTISIAPPVSSPAEPSRSAIGTADRPSLSLLAGDVVRMVASNVRTSAVGAFTANKVRVTFDIAIENRLPGIRLITPTWPVAPAAGVILFPIDYVVTLAPGGVSGGGGNTILVEQPRFGTVTPSADFDGTGAPGSGAPYNFFTETNCAQTASRDCFRWKAYESSIAPQSTSSQRTIGFDIDPSVAQFRARMIVAADLAASEVGARTIMRRASGNEDVTPRAQPAPSSASPGPPASRN